MLEAPALNDELDRLAELYALNLLDTPREERFDRLTRLARRALGTGMCYLALIDSERQWFKSKCGIARDSTSRQSSFCGHTIAEDGMMVVPDALLDERFYDNPLVIGDPYVRFYAGYPLRGPQGHAVGTFCLADSAPRDWGEAERNLFEEFALLAQRELHLTELILDQKRLLETQAELETARHHLARELNEAAEFVQQKLPARFETGRMKLDWAFIASSQLGGDMFGLEPLGNDRLLIYLLDVAGHGIGASLLAVSIQNTLQQMAGAMDGSVSPARILGDLNSAFQMNANHNRFFTMWCGVIDLTEKTICYANGGHPAPTLFNGNLDAEPLAQNGLIIGISATAVYEDAIVAWTPDSRLILFSDGILEELDENGEQFGRTRLEDAWKQRCLQSNCPLDIIIDKLGEWNGNRPFADDVSLVELTLK